MELRFYNSCRHNCLCWEYFHYYSDGAQLTCTSDTFVVSLYFLLGLTVMPSRFKLSKSTLSAACRSLLLALKKLGRNAAAMTSLHNGKTCFVSFQSQLVANLYSQLRARFFFSLVRMLRAFTCQLDEMFAFYPSGQFTRVLTSF